MKDNSSTTTVVNFMCLRTAISISLHISNVKDKFYVAVDAKKNELEEFGIDTALYGELCQEIQDVFNRVLKKEK